LVVSAPKQKAPLAALLLIIALAFAVYLRTMAPTITFRHNGSDSGDLVTAAINLGVPHPTGYPLYTLLAHLFTRLPGEPARSVNLFSALCGAAAAGMVFWAAYRLIATREGDGLPAWVAALSAAGVFAFGQLLWSQATIAEVYGLNALWAAASLVVVLELLHPDAGATATHSQSGRGGLEAARPCLLAFLFGLGLAHHVTAVWLLPALWPYAGAVRRWLTPRRAVLLLLCLLPGLLTYLYIPLRARVHPVPNWGLATDLAGLRWLVSGAAYHRYFGGVAPAELLQRFAAWAGIWVRDLGVAGLALTLLGLWRGLERDRRFAMFGLTYVLFQSAYSMLYITGDSYLYLLPAAAVAALWMAWGAYSVLRELASPIRTGRAAVRLGMVLLLALPVMSVASRWRDMDLSTDREAYLTAEAMLQAAAPDGLILSRGDSHTFSLWYVRYGLRQRPDVDIIDSNLLAFAWYRTDLAARNPELASLLEARHEQEAVLMLLSIPGRPLQLTYEDELLVRHGTWTQEGPLYTLVP
jgi:hypothetical protein